ncbi:MAG: hypothetical protein EBE86_028980 [Hormoscilla sp. GUM202]|nr:hypothetical protein [Hormoscilla sp. GUM202]
MKSCQFYPFHDSKIKLFQSIPQYQREVCQPSNPKVCHEAISHPAGPPEIAEGGELLLQHKDLSIIPPRNDNSLLSPKAQFLTVRSILCLPADVCLRFVGGSDYPHLTRGRLLLLSGDKGYNREESLHYRGEPIINVHGSFSMDNTCKIKGGKCYRHPTTILA